jgi:hypothetical protein
MKKLGGRLKDRKVPSQQRARKRGKATVENYTAYAVMEDGSRHQLDARSIVVVLAGTEVEVDLRRAHGVVSGHLRVAVPDEGRLGVAHGDASSIHLFVQAPPVAKRP